MSDSMRSLSGSYGTGSDLPVRPGLRRPTTPSGPLAAQIVAAGTAVTVFGAGTIDDVADIINPPDATATLYIDIVATAAIGAATSVPLTPGQSYRISGPIASVVTAVSDK